MNRTSLIAALAITLAAGTASAESYAEYNTPFASNGSSAAVGAERVQARQSGVNPWSTSYNPFTQFRSTQTRAQVVAAYIAERDAVVAFTGEDSGSAYLSARLPLAAPARLAGQQVNAR